MHAYGLLEGAVEPALAASMRAAHPVLGRWCFTPQRRAKQAVEQRPEEVQRWLRVDYPSFIERAKLGFGHYAA